MTVIAVDTSVAIPLLVATHRAHAAVSRWWNGREVALSGHALAETYSVLTRLPGDLRLAPADAARLLGERFAEPLLLGPDVAGRLADVLGGLGIAGGAVYDALGLVPGSTVDISRYGAGLQLLPTGRTARLVDECGVLVATGDTVIDDDVVFGLIDSARIHR